MSDRPVTVAVFAFGIAVGLVGVVHPNPPQHATLWIGIGAVYATAAAAFGLYRELTDERSIPFAFSIAVAIASVLLTVCLRLIDVKTARPNEPIIDLTFVLWRPLVLVPFTIAFLSPLGIATNQNERRLVAIALMLPFGIAAGRWILRGVPWGSMFAVYYFGFLFLGSIVAGVPMYLYASRSAPE
ncbi:hypothetical protein [Halorientalis halophila]|uniref:hypothetical protein n=1 Tax=Halorientalis halophila TaxID=3108499 RepID=UPI00300A0B5C